MTERRVQIAALIAPCVPTILLFMIGFLGQSFQWDFLIAGLAIFTSYLGAFVVGFPLVHLLRRVGWLSLPTLMLSGAMLGIFVFYVALLFITFTLGSPASFGFLEALWGVLFGLVAALSFGLIAGIPWHQIRCETFNP